MGLAKLAAPGRVPARELAGPYGGGLAGEHESSSPPARRPPASNNTPVTATQVADIFKSLLSPLLEARAEAAPAPAFDVEALARQLAPHLQAAPPRPAQRRGGPARRAAAVDSLTGVCDVAKVRVSLIPPSPTIKLAFIARRRGATPVA
jgi:hypothetical protein